MNTIFEQLTDFKYCSYIELISMQIYEIRIFSTLTKHITPPTSSASRQISVIHKQEAFVESKKSKMKQAQSLIESRNGHRKLSEVLSYSDGEVPYTSLLTNDYLLETVFKNEGD